MYISEMNISLILRPHGEVFLRDGDMFEEPGGTARGAGATRSWWISRVSAMYRFDISI